MKGSHAFSPRTGSPLSSEKHHPGPVYEAPKREAEDGSGELTLGETHSSQLALLEYFHRAYSKSHYGQPPPDDVKLLAGRALYELKRHAGGYRDEWIWLALTEYLARNGIWSTWMHNHVDLPCPRCGSLCRWKPTIVGLDKVSCGANCGAEKHSERSIEIVDKVFAAYQAALGDPENPIEELVSL